MLIQPGKTQDTALSELVLGQVQYLAKLSSQYPQKSKDIAIIPYNLTLNNTV